MFVYIRFLDFPISFPSSGNLSAVFFSSGISSGTRKCTEEDFYQMDKPTLGKGKTDSLDTVIEQCNHRHSGDN